MITIQSFGFKYGLPTISDYIFDVRILTNPYYKDELRQLTGNDQAVVEYILSQPQTEKFLKSVEGVLDFIVEEFTQMNRIQMVISVGCTGGRHRSVFAANQLVKYLNSKGLDAKAVHRDIDK